MGRRRTLACYGGEDRYGRNRGVCSQRKLGPGDVKEATWLAAGLPWVSETVDHLRGTGYWDDPMFIAVCDSCLAARIGRPLTEADYREGLTNPIKL